MTEFAEKVFAVVKKIPKGQVLTYKQVAIKAGHPKAAQAVGNILHQNHNPKIPCHRVIRTDGQLGGYNRGAINKRRILKLEGYLQESNAHAKNPATQVAGFLA